MANRVQRLLEQLKSDLNEQEQGPPAEVVQQAVSELKSVLKSHVQAIHDEKLTDMLSTIDDAKTWVEPDIPGQRYIVPLALPCAGGYTAIAGSAAVIEYNSAAGKWQITVEIEGC